MQLKSLVMMFILLTFSAHAFAVSPEIRLPEWFKSEFAIIEWSPDEEILVVSASLSAPKVALHEVSCSLEENFGQSRQSKEKKREVIKKGDKAVFMFRLHVKPEARGWINFDLRARPDSQGLLAEIVRMSDKPLTQKVLESEALKLQQPILLGQSMPVFVAEDIAMGITAELALRPRTKEGCEVYLWLPEERFGTGIKAESLKAMKKAEQANQFRSAAAACTLIINKLSHEKNGLKAEPTKGEIFEIPNQIAIDLLTLNQATFSSLENAERSSELKKLLLATKSSYIKAFASFNLAQIYAGSGDKTKAAKLLQTAMEIIPTWPKAAAFKDKIAD